MLKQINGRWFLVLSKTTAGGGSAGTIRIAVDQVSVINDEGKTCGIATNSGFIAAVAMKADDVWALMERATPPASSGVLND